MDLREILSLYSTYDGTLTKIKDLEQKCFLIDNPVAIEHLCYNIGNKMISLEETKSIIDYLSDINYSLNYHSIGIGAAKIGNIKLLEWLCVEGVLDHEYILGWFNQTEDKPNRKTYNFLLSIRKIISSYSTYDGTLLWLQKKENEGNLWHSKNMNTKSRIRNKKTASINLSYYIGHKVIDLQETKLIIDWLRDGEYLVNYNSICIGAAIGGNIELLKYLNSQSWLNAKQVLNCDGIDNEIKLYLEQINKHIEELIELGDEYCNVESDENFNNTTSYMRDKYEDYKDCWYDDWYGWSIRIEY